MTGKYTSPLKYRVAQAQRLAMRTILAGLSHWDALDDPQDGYTICIGAASKLAGMLGANLELLARQDLAHCERIYIVFDAPARRLPPDIEPRARQAYPDLPLEFVYYSPNESRILDALGFPGAYSWFSWHKALARCRTRHAILHDFDALLLRPTLLEERYRATIDADARWSGQRFYNGMGIESGDGLATTFEMVLDAAFVRSRFRPIDAFNKVTIYKGRTVEFDTFLECQTRGGKSIAIDIPEEDMVHPSQVVHQFTQLTHIPDFVPPPNNRLLMIPYFLYLGGDERPLRETRAALEQLDGKQDRTIPFLGRRMNLSCLGHEHVRWLALQAQRVESFLVGAVREEVRGYFEAAESAALGQTPIPLS